MSDGNGEDESGAAGWVKFIVIYGVINLITYNTLGIYVIPIPGFRR